MSVVISMENVQKSFMVEGHSVPVLKDMSFQVKEGEVVCLIGPSGGGKSTCLRSINGLETIDEGRISVCGINYDSDVNAVYKIRQRTGMIFQRFELFPHLTALENITLGLIKVKGFSKNRAAEKAVALLETVGLKSHSSKHPHSLSGGQQQRVAIARALATEPQVLLCDEPTSALDPELVDEVTEILDRVAKSGMTMLIVTHEMRFAKQVADRILFLEQGRIMESGSVPEIFENPKTPRLQQFLNKIHAS